MMKKKWKVMKMGTEEGWMLRFWKVVVVGGLDEEEKIFLTAQSSGVM